MTYRVVVHRAHKDGAKCFVMFQEKMANHIKTDLENKIYKQLWNEANAAVFQNLSSE